MAKPLLSDELWAEIEPELPPESPKPKGGRPRVPDRACLTGGHPSLILWKTWPSRMGTSTHPEPNSTPPTLRPT